MTVLYLTNNPRLAGTARILLSWLTLGREHDAPGTVVVQQPGELSEWLDAHAVPWTRSPMPWLDLKWPVPALREAWRVARWARRRGVSIVHCNEHDVYPFGVLVARLMWVPVVCHVRFAVHRGFATWAFGGWRLPDALLWTTNQQRMDCAEAIRGVVPDDRQHLVRLGPNQDEFAPVPAGRGELRQTFDIREHELAIGTATALRPVKRIHDFVDLIVELAGRHPEVVGLIAGGAVPGDEAYCAEVERRIAGSGLGRRLRWLGHREPVAPFLQSLDLFVSTSEYETFGNSVAEAMACGLPVVGYTGGSVHEIIGEAGTVVPNGDLAGLVAGVERLIQHPEERIRAAESCRHRAATDFNPAVSFERLHGLHARLVAGKSSN